MMTHFPESEIQEALELYRAALNDAIEELGGGTSSEAIIAHARELLRDEDEDAFDLVTEITDSEQGDHFWELEEELIENRSDDSLHDVEYDENAADSYLR